MTPSCALFRLPAALVSRLPAALVIALLCALAATAGADDRALPAVMIVATGGTIAGVQDDPKDPSRYRAGSLGAEEIVASVPGLDQVARVETLQFSNVPSTQVRPEDWVRLSHTITTLLTERDDLAGIIITHGTDRLEETAFFLHLTVGSDKPVVVVGAQRPATNASADGPANLLAAVRTAVAPESRDRGVLVVMDERILSAREVRKDYPRMGGFGAGRIGIVDGDGPHYLYRPTRPHTHRSPFRVTPDTPCPPSTSCFPTPAGKVRSTWSLRPASSSPPPT